MNVLSFVNIKMTYKLPGMFVGCALIATLAIGFSSFIGGTGIVKELSFTGLQALQETRQQAISDYLESIEQDMRFVAASPLTRQAVQEFEQAWEDLGGDQAQTLQRLYIEDNPNPTGAKENLDFAPDGSLYSAVHKRFRAGVQNGSGLVQHQHRRVHQRRARQGDQLILPSGEH